MTKLRTKIEEWIDVINSYGFSLYRGGSDLVEGIETIICATFWFLALGVLFVVDFALLILGACVGSVIKVVEFFVKPRS